MSDEEQLQKSKKSVNDLPKRKKKKEEEHSAGRKPKKEIKDVEVKAKTKQESEEKKKKKKKVKGKEGGEGEVVEEKKKKKRKKKEEEEEEGAECRFPMSRVDRIIRSEGSDYRITHEAVFLINKATEKFLQVFGEDSYKCAAQDRKNYVSYKNLSSVVSKDRSFYFLSDYIPEKVKAEKALAERNPVEK